MSGIEITIYNADQSIVCQPSYEAHTIERASEIIQATKGLLKAGQTISVRAY